MNAVFTYSVRSLITLQRLLMTGLIVLGSFTLSAQAATVSVSNYPLFLLSEAVTEGAPSAKRLLQTGEVGHHGSISQVISSQSKTVSLWYGLVSR
ncbi:hypothetical protein [Psychrobacter sp. JCM 18901]|uniref:hypothetical protein n=1 Tax=Psychrobacter sp. JCM 18901 TaxID=1298609 RepID=UPI0004AC7545|nr:hypothetical protein [Psychrobacter sp. JCM 18901]